MIGLRLPNITAATPQEQTRQITAFLRQLVTELNAVLEELDGKTGGHTNGK